VFCRRLACAFPQWYGHPIPVLVRLDFLSLMQIAHYQMTDARIRRISVAIGVGVLLGAILYLAFGERNQSAFKRGDFPAFYAAAEIVWTGRGSELYEYNLQRDLENLYWPEFEGDFFIFAYPPFFALLISPLASLPPFTAKAVASALLLVFLLAAVFLARKATPFFDRHLAFSLLYLLTLVPLGASIIGVQNTALSILCFTLFYSAVPSQRPVLTGLSASLLLYKPQFGLLLFFYLVGRVRRQELIGWGIGAFLLYLLGVPVLGISWPWIWLQEAAQFGDINFTINNQNMISLAGVMYWGFTHWLDDGARGLPWAYAVSAILLLLSVHYIRARHERLVLVPYLVLFLAPQALFYDLGLAVFIFMQAMRPYRTKDFLLLGGLWLYSAVAMGLRDDIAFPLFTLPLLIMFWIHARRINESAVKAP